MSLSAKPYRRLFYRRRRFKCFPHVGCRRVGGRRILRRAAYMTVEPTSARWALSFIGDD